MPEAISSEDGLALLRTLRRGQTITGTVTEIASFGVTFVDIGSFTAMINIPELSWRPIKHPSDAVSVGQKITAVILDVEVERGRVPLSLKALQPDPLKELQLQAGLPVAGTVTKITPIGVFVRIEDRPDGFEGLLPQRLLADDSAVVGEVLNVRIVAVDVARRRIELAPAEPASAEPADAGPLPDDRASALEQPGQVRESLNWVESAGGPLLVAPRSDLTHWGGSTDDDGPVETWGDYGRACTVEGYIGLVAIGAQQALVLGDEPAPTTYLPAERLFLRWAAASSESVLVAAAKQAMHGKMQWSEDEDLFWDVRGSVVLFDAALPGTVMEPYNHLVVDLAPGRYRVRAASLTVHDNWMILVQLQPTEQVAA